MLETAKFLVASAKVFGVIPSLLLLTTSLLIYFVARALSEQKKATEEQKLQVMERNKKIDQLESDITSCARERGKLRAENSQLQFRLERVTAHSEILSKLLDRRKND